MYNACHCVCERTFLGSGDGGLVQALPALIAASHSGQVDPPTEQTLSPAKGVHSKVLVARSALLAPLENLCPTVWTRLLLSATAKQRESAVTQLAACVQLQVFMVYIP